MTIDFSPVKNNEITYLEFARQFSVDDLRVATNAYYDLVAEILEGADDAQIAHIPDDPHADDPYAVEGEEHIGWSLAHLVLHVTATLEEGAAFGSLVARGIPAGGRLRVEPDWKLFTTCDQVYQRLKESRRIVNAYFDTWPDEPSLDTMRDLSPKFVARFGEMNAPATYLFALKHFDDHMGQLREVAAQAREAAANGTIRTLADFPHLAASS